MFKKIIFYLILFFCIVPTLVNASDNAQAKIGNNYYDSLLDAIKAAGPNDTITLTSNVVLDETLEINKTVNLNLNGKTISAKEQVFLVQGGVLNLSGEGTIKETIPNYGAIMVKGSTNTSDKDYSIVNIGKDITLEGWSGIFINHDSTKAYGIEVNLSGHINAVNDINGGSGVGIYVNGNIKDQTNEPVINIKDSAEITSSGNGLYIAGNSTFNIKKAYISGIESGIGIKSGTLNIDGTTIIGTGKDETPTEGYNNGIKASGTSIQIESNNGYAGNIKINIDSGTFRSKNSNVIYEYIGKGNNTTVSSINIKGGNFESEANKEVFLLSNSFETKHPNFITGGTYSSDPSSYLEAGYNTILESDLFTVIKSTMKEVNINNNTTPTNSLWKPLIIITLISVLIVIAYLNRTKIFNLFKR